jgi:excinuclease ABC subunit C
MVKDDYHKTRALTDGEGEISFAADRGLYNFIYAIQEEAHRFAVKSVHDKKRKTLRRSSLEDIPGIGPKKAKILLSHYGGIARIREADADAIAALPGLSDTDAARIRAYFDKQEGNKQS